MSKYSFEFKMNLVKMIRYYGIYARHRDVDRYLIRMRSSKQHRFLKSLNQWRSSILLCFGYDPIQCPLCQTKMLVLDVFYDHHRVSLEKLYERKMRSFKASKWRSSA